MLSKFEEPTLSQIIAKRCRFRRPLSENQATRVPTTPNSTCMESTAMFIAIPMPGYSAVLQPLPTCQDRDEAPDGLPNASH